LTSTRHALTEALGRKTGYSGKWRCQLTRYGFLDERIIANTLCDA